MGLAFNHDSTLLATAAASSKDVAIRVHRVADGKMVAQYDLTAAKQMVSQLAFSPKESILAFALDDTDPPKAGNLIYWDWKKKEILHKMAGFKYPVSQLIFSPNGEFLVTGGGPASQPRIPTGGSEIVVWSRDGKRVADLQGLQGEVESLAFSGDGDLLAASAVDTRNPMKIVTWQSKGWKHGTTLTAKERFVIHGLRFRDKNTLLSASADGVIRAWDLRNSRIVGRTVYWKEK